MMVTVYCIPCSKLFTEWKSCIHSSDLDKLALASSLLISWLGENLRKLNEEQHVEMVSEILNFLHIQ